MIELIVNKPLEKPTHQLDGCWKHNVEPTHTKSVTMYLCQDARKEDCPYNVDVLINTPYVSFHQNICVYNMRKQSNPPTR